MTPKVSRPLDPDIGSSSTPCPPEEGDNPVVKRVARALLSRERDEDIICRAFNKGKSCAEMGFTSLSEVLACLRQLGRDASTIRKLIIGYSCILDVEDAEEMGRMLPGLQELDLDCVSGGRLIRLSFLSHLTGLQVLTIDPRSLVLTDENLKLVGCCTQLNSLLIDPIDPPVPVSDEGLGSLTALKKLTSLCLGLGSQFTERAIVVTISVLTNLRTLSIPMTTQLSDEGLRSLVSPLTNLDTLDIHGCDRITRRGIESLTQLTRLRNLDITQIPHLTEADLKPLKSLKIERIEIGEDDHFSSSSIP